ncbi:MAG: adenosylmethionine--8-amino-7-oxononanoate transaminase [Victivallales bacterium]|jgi:adenosylmethionine-8-amino-7-oxononanoate aminotransferase|nr:adenosylmethionine--8-amino-7-oxononanoate transaminase [Victivallales bacterium]
MNRHELLEFDRKHLWHPYASMSAPPPVNLAIAAKGTRIRLDDRQELIDGVSSWWCTAHGHNHPEIVAAIREQAEKFAQVMFAGFTHQPAIELAAALIKRTPAGVNKVFFADSGSVAVECAAKMAIQYQYAKGKTQRSRLAALRGGYHGDTAGAMALCDPEGMHHVFGAYLQKNLFLPQPHLRFEEEWSESEFTQIEELLERHKKEIAGVFIEPVFQGGNAMRFYHPMYMKHLREICDRLEILLIIDEIATGFGRIGRYFGCEYAGIAPDIMCVGKGLTGGSVTLSAAIASEEVAEVISGTMPGKFMHGPTFMANPIACAAGVASLRLFDSYDWKAKVDAIEIQLKRELETCKNHPNVADVRVLGAIGVLELRTPPTPERVQKLIRETGVWLRPFGNWLYTMPPFITPSNEISTITQAMKQML